MAVSQVSRNDGDISISFHSRAACQKYGGLTARLPSFLGCFPGNLRTTFRRYSFGARRTALMAALRDPLFVTLCAFSFLGLAAHFLFRRHPLGRALVRVVFLGVLTIVLLHAGIVPYQPLVLTGRPLEDAAHAALKIAWWALAAWFVVDGHRDLTPSGRGIRQNLETGKGADALERRPQLAAALAEARRLKCAVVVAKLDRLSRNVASVAGLMAQRVRFIVAELGPTLSRSSFTFTRPSPNKSGRPSATGRRVRLPPPRREERASEIRASPRLRRRARHHEGEGRAIRRQRPTAHSHHAGRGREPEKNRRGDRA